MVKARILEDVEKFLKFKGARINGSTAKGLEEANLGELLAKIAKINVNDTINLLYNGKTFTLTVVGIFTSQTELDAEVIIPMKVFHPIDEKVSIIEFSLKGNVDKAKTIDNIVETLPETVKVVKVQQPDNFIHQLNTQTTNFLNIWSLAVYTIVASASYIITSRLTAESSYELAMLKALGAKRRQIFTLVLTSTATLTLLGSALGISLGLVGIQVTSTMLRWITPNIDISPFLQPEQVLQTLLLTIASSIIGCIHPAYKTTRTTYMEQTL